MGLRAVFVFWLPLFASWLLMTSEGPIITAAVNRLPDEVVMLAAAGIVISLSVMIESPIINLLSTATALVKDRHSFFLVRRFTLHWMAILTLVTIVMAFTPVFDLVVRRWMGAPSEVARWVRPGLQIMTLWSAAIAWRRFLQGVLIRFEQTRKVAWGTLIRLLFSGGVAVGMAIWGLWPGVIVGAVAWMGGVVAEAIYATWAVRRLLGQELGAESDPSPGPELTYRRLFWFHLPLAGTAALSLLAQPMVAFSLARLQNPTQSLAAWPMVFQMMLMMRAAGMALPEVVIALSDRSGSFVPLRRFAMLMAGVTMASMLLLVLTPLARIYLVVIQDASADVSAIAQTGLTLFLFLPVMTVMVSWLRGLLIKQGTTTVLNWGMALNVAITGFILAMGIVFRLPGIPTAAVALSVALAVELIYLWWRATIVLDAPLLAPAVPG